MELKTISEISSQIIIDLRYAGLNNVFKKKLYPDDFTPKLHKDAYDALLKAIKLANQAKKKLKIWDVYRPFKVQQKMFEICSNSDFISDPETGSVPHCRGVAVDLTLCELNGNEIEMGTDFDDFTEKAFHKCELVSKDAKANRYLLKNIMVESGFDFYENEWWHYQLFNARNYKKF